MNITVKNLKHAEFASEETYCFEATVYVDNERFCLASNDGHGGCDRYEPLGGNSQSDLYIKIAKIDETIKRERASEFETHTRKDGTTFETGPDFEEAVNAAVTNALIEKDVKRILRRVVFIKPDTEKGKYFTLGSHLKPSPKTYAIVKDAPWWKPEYTILNELSFDKAAAHLS